MLNLDDRIQLRAEPGHEVVVLGYEDEPYLRFGADGTVDVNERSPAYYLNQDRFGEVEVPPDADPAAEPRWAEVAAAGTYDWHDHRIHYMAEGTPPQVTDESVETKVFDWAVAPARRRRARGGRGHAHLGARRGRRVGRADRRARGCGRRQLRPLRLAHAPAERRARGSAELRRGRAGGLVRARAPILATLALALAAPAAAEAHAVLESTRPGAGASLASAPAEVSLRFDEPVEATFGAVRVFDRRDRRSRRASSCTSSPRTVAVSLPEELPTASTRRPTGS